MEVDIVIAVDVFSKAFAKISEVDMDLVACQMRSILNTILLIEFVPT